MALQLSLYLCVLYGSQNNTAIISLYIINWLVFITETEWVYCAARRHGLDLSIQFRLFLVCKRTAKTLVRSQASPWDFAFDKGIMGQVYRPELLFSPVGIVPPMLHTYIHLHGALTRRTNGWRMRTFQKGRFFRNSVECWIERYFRLVSEGLSNNVLCSACDL